jgi:hypothetical protein
MLARLIDVNQVLIELAHPWLEEIILYDFDYLILTNLAHNIKIILYLNII